MSISYIFGHQLDSPYHSFFSVHPAYTVAQPCAFLDITINLISHAAAPLKICILVWFVLLVWSSMLIYSLTVTFAHLLTSHSMTMQWNLLSLRQRDPGNVYASEGSATPSSFRMALSFIPFIRSGLREAEGYFSTDSSLQKSILHCIWLHQAVAAIAVEFITPKLPNSFSFPNSLSSIVYCAPLLPFPPLVYISLSLALLGRSYMYLFFFNKSD